MVLLRVHMLPRPTSAQRLAVTRGEVRDTCIAVTTVSLRATRVAILVLTLHNTFSVLELLYNTVVLMETNELYLTHARSVSNLLFNYFTFFSIVCFCLAEVYFVADVRLLVFVLFT